MIGLEDLGSAAVQGLVLGIIAAFVFNFASRVIKILLIVQFIILKWLESRRIVIVDWSKISFGLIDETDLVQQADSLLASLIETGSFGAAAIIGFIVTKSLIKSQACGIPLGSIYRLFATIKGHSLNEHAIWDCHGI